MKIEAATRSDVRFVASKMRDRDAAEFLAVSDALDQRALVEKLVPRYARDGICARADMPVAVGAMFIARPNVATLGFFATDEFPSIVVGLTRFIRTVLFPRYRAAGVHRIECISKADYADAHRWIELLGLTQEATMRGFGRGGEDYVQFAWVK